MEALGVGSNPIVPTAIWPMDLNLMWEWVWEAENLTGIIIAAKSKLDINNFFIYNNKRKKYV
jgi:hypothetical protein